ncbi:OmpA/MotB family protein [Aurantibacter aestuarii]|uniref:Cell envelope biogenesis protein OmpA n=1 Tax=Aurantibacter aestuarii TaxID=1266046 RepID=A0A2T1N866_9FLAO|nr:OmpA family protein [Aurantibacter aestuarii]PSG88064.1 cell envelope biogenesis protein OmpA [Aurantibacter aestuarii]
MKKVSAVLLTAILFTGCVSKKKYVALETDRNQLKSELQKTTVERDELEAKFEAIEARIDTYNAKINALREESNSKLTTSDGAVISKGAREQMRKTISKMDPAAVSGAKTLKDSMNLAVAYNLKQTMAGSTLNDDANGEVDININETVVMITIADNLLFRTASYKMSNKADGVLQKIADLLKSEPSLDVMVEGHTDSRTIRTAFIKDNWDLSVLRATSIVRRLQDKFGVESERLIASGRSSFQPLVDNDTNENRAKNRRTRIVIMPNIDKFFALMEEKK